MSLPSKFEFQTKYDLPSRYTLTLDSDTGKYVCRNVTSLEDAYNVPATYSVKFVQEAIDCGNWIMTKNLDVPPATKPEISSEDRPMVFPFTVMHGSEEYQHEDAPESLFVVDKSAKEGYVKVTWRNGVVSDGVWTIDEVKAIIVGGVWIVKSVGQLQATAYDDEKDEDLIGTGFWIQSGALKLDNATITAPQAPESAPTSIGKLALDVDTGEALAKIKALTQAVEDLNISLESLAALKGEIFK